MEHEDKDDHGDPFAGLEDWGRAAERRARRRQWLRRLRGDGARNVAFVVSAVVVAVVLAAGWPTIRTWLPSGSSASAADDDAAPYPTQSVPDGVSATSSASARPTGPFVGTPAEAYAKGAAGISLPPATAVTGFTAAQVDAALQQVRAALVAGRLEPAMTVGHDSSGLLKLLAPNDRKPVGAWFGSTDFSSVATWIDPAVKLDPAEEPRVSGRVTFSSARVDDIQTLQVTTNFVWVYAFKGTESPIAVVHDEVRWDFPKTDRLRNDDKGMWIGESRSYMAWIDCAAAGKGLLAPTPPNRTAVPGSPDTEDQNSYLRADRSLDIPDDCGDPSPSPSRG
ncbi:hypothetical protein ACPPVO_14705 [Dactylosporangium sp. McL0621]|uniref:hypothetical protein n=1 Tax=Dactylosporangium sp. McL0621 TaxID=3415678 RepID=UPI003CF0F152